MSDPMMRACTHTEDHSDAHVHESTAETDRVIAQEQLHVEAAATERDESSRRRTQVPPRNGNDE